MVQWLRFCASTAKVLDRSLVRKLRSYGHVVQLKILKIKKNLCLNSFYTAQLSSS